MKKILSFALVFCMLLFCIPLSVACTEPPHPLMNLTIKNYSDYKELSIGYIIDNSNPSPQPQSANLAMQVMNTETLTSQGKKKVGLIGKHKNGYYEQLEFEEKKESEIIKTHYGLHGYLDEGPFLFLCYTTYSTGRKPVMGMQSVQGNQVYILLVDKASGKIFDVTEEPMNLLNEPAFYYTSNAFFSWTYKGLYKYTVENNILKRETILENHQSDFDDPLMVDRFNNVYFNSTEDYTKTYIITNQGQLKTLTNAKFAANNIMYVDNQWINENGELENATFIPTDFTNLKFKDYQHHIDFTILLHQEANTYYYRTGDHSDTIVKYTFLNDIEYTIEKIKFEKYSPNFSAISINKKLYFLSGTEIFYIDIDTGKANTIVSNYFFDQLYQNDTGDLVFEAIDAQLNQIKGTINPETDTTQIGVTKKEKNIFFRTAIN